MYKYGLIWANTTIYVKRRYLLKPRENAAALSRHMVWSCTKVYGEGNKRYPKTERRAISKYEIMWPSIPNTDFKFNITQEMLVLVVVVSIISSVLVMVFGKMVCAFTHLFHTLECHWSMKYIGKWNNNLCRNSSICLIS